MTSTHTTQLILASASPRRSELLQQLELEYHVHVVEIDEVPQTGEAPANFVERMAKSKAQAAYINLREEHKKFGLLVVLGADTSVVCDGEILGKPDDKDAARTQLQLLSGRTHEVLTGVAIAAADEDSEMRVQFALSHSEVEFEVIDDSIIEAYLQTDEPYDKAGSYAVQGLAAQFIKHISGSYSGIMGLPLYETAKLLKPFNIHTFKRLL
ncbi:MAG: septum formation inhibitor Maf [Gammaproteobacteria bacterium]|nr:septum formation inhibitor Maf [Gammaproteobacteria bacterium]